MLQMASAHFEVSCNYMHIGDIPAKVCWRTKTCWQRPIENNRRIGMKSKVLQVLQAINSARWSTMIRWNPRLAKILRNSHEYFIPRGAVLNQYSRQSSILNWSERMRNPARRCFVAANINRRCLLTYSECGARIELLHCWLLCVVKDCNMMWRWFDCLTV